MAKKANQDGLKKLSQTQVYCNVRNVRDQLQEVFSLDAIFHLGKKVDENYKIDCRNVKKNIYIFF